MIPKIIHYCWLSGDAYPEKIAKCISTWRDCLRDYEIWLWDTKQFDINSSLWVKQAYEQKKYAFAADFIRLYAVYHYGGIYLDSDVEVVKKFDNLLHLPYFIGRESIGNRVEVAAFGAEKGCKWVKQCLDYYHKRPFIKADGSFDTKVMPEIVYESLSPSYKINLIDNIQQFDFSDNVFNEFPNNWFCANIKPSINESPVYKITDETYCVHHFANSWILTPQWKLKVAKILKKLSFLYRKRIKIS